MKSRYRIIFFILINCFQGFGQSHTIDSIRNVLKTEHDDTNKVNTLCELSMGLEGISKYDSSLKCAENALALADKVGFSRRISSIFIYIGNIYDDKGDYIKALDYYTKALKINEETGYKKGAVNALCDIGVIYYEQGDYSHALDYYLKALKISEDMHNKEGIAVNLGNIGIVYDEMGDSSKALDYYRKSLQMEQELGNERLQAGVLISIGLLYADQAKYSQAIDCYEKAIKLYQKLGDKNGLTVAYGDMGGTYSDLGDNNKALGYYLDQLKVSEEIGNKAVVSVSKANIGGLYTKIGKFKEAEEYLLQAIKLSDSIGTKGDLRVHELYLSQLYDTTGRYKLALEYYKKAAALKDTLFNIEKNKAITRKEMNYEFEKKEALAEADKRKQRIVTWSVLCGLLLVLVFAGFIFRSLRITRKQKQVIEKKNIEILDSIIYAKRLQDAILPPMAIIRKYLPDSFLLYKPKDIVAGDFYWMEQAGDNIMIAAADCTGHGVPGALVSVVCSNALNRTVKEFHITEPGKILDKVRELVLETFEKSESNVQDGMDISLCCMNTKTKEIQWSGAYNSLWYIRDGRICEVAADKQPIGKHDKPQPFNTHKLNLQKGDMLYLFTDGYADQFGGPKGKKFKYKQLQEILLANSSNPMEEQRVMLESRLNEWKGDLEQVDDILVIGIQV